MGRIRIRTALLAAGAAIALIPAQAGAATFSNSAPITINDLPFTGCSTGPDAGQATPYPSQIQVSGLASQVTDVNATITGFTHPFTSDVRMLLVGPHGQSTELLSNVGGSSDVSDLNITFDDSAADPVPTPPVSGTFKPTLDITGCDVDPDADFPSPAPASPYGMDLAAFDGADPNGTWSLYAVDDSGGDSGSISGGWSLDLAAVEPAPPQTTPTPAPAPTKDPKCAKLHKKLKRQKRNLANATSSKKQQTSRVNIADTKKRLQHLGC
jgi:subtilisin-like proprotein convertase family protein